MKKQILSLLFLLSAAHAADKGGLNAISEESSFFTHTQIQPNTQRNNNDNSFISDDSDEELHLLCASLQFNTETLELENFKNKFNESTSFVSSFITQTSQKLEKLHKDLDKMKKKYDKAKETAFKYKELYGQVKAEKDALMEEKNSKLNSLEQPLSNKSEEKISTAKTRRFPGGNFAELLTEIEGRLGKNFVKTNLQDSFSLIVDSTFLTYFNASSIEIKKELIYKAFVEFFLRSVNFDSRLTKDDIFVFFSSTLKTQTNIDLKKLNLLQSGYVQDFLDKSEFVTSRRLTRSVQLPLSRDTRRSSSLTHSHVRLFKNK